MKITKEVAGKNWGKDFTDDKGKQHIWVQGFQKYMDDLTPDEWEQMTDADCDSHLRDCEYVQETDNEGKR